MAEKPDWKKLRKAGKSYTDSTRKDLERIAQDLANQGVIVQGKVQEFVDAFTTASKDRADDFLDALRSEFERQLDALGVATKKDLKRLRAELRADDKKPAKKPAKKAAAKKAAKKAAPKKAAKKGTAKKAAKKKSPRPSTNGSS